MQRPSPGKSSKQKSSLRTYERAKWKEQADHSRRQLVARLPKQESIRARLLARRMDRCDLPEDPCGSAGCPSCVNHAQDDLVRALLRPLREAKDTTEVNVFFVTIVPRRAAAEVGKLASLSMQNLLRRTKEGLKATAIEWGVLVLDMTLNEHEDNRYEPRWQAHFHGMVVTHLTREELSAALVEAFPRSQTIPKPVAVHDWNGSSRAIRYLLKFDVGRRIGRDSVEKYDHRTGKIRICKNTKPDRLRAAEQTELALYLDSHTITDRFLCIECRIRSSSGGLTLAIL